MVRNLKKEAVTRGRREEGESNNGSNRQEAHDQRVLRSQYLAVKNLIRNEREDITQVDSDKFKYIFTQVESLHKLVQKPREQVADPEALLDIANTLLHGNRFVPVRVREHVHHSSGIGYKFKFQIPSYFSLVIRSLAVLEGIAISFDPNYKVLSSSYPWIARKVLTDSSPQLRSSLETLLYKDGVFRIDRLESLLSESLRARTEQSLVRKDDENTDSSVAIKQVFSFTLTKKGAFVREILLQEFAKGLDALGLATFDYVASAASRLPLAVSLSSSSISDEDVTNLRTLRRLLLLLSRLQKNENATTKIEFTNAEHNGNVYMEEVSLVMNQIISAQDFLPVLSVIPELPPESQQQLIRLPADLAGRLLSRAAARTIRRLLA